MLKREDMLEQEIVNSVEKAIEPLRKQAKILSIHVNLDKVADSITQCFAEKTITTSADFAKTMDKKDAAFDDAISFMKEKGIVQAWKKCLQDESSEDIFSIMEEVLTEDEIAKYVVVFYIIAHSTKKSKFRKIVSKEELIKLLLVELISLIAARIQAKHAQSGKD